MRAWLHAWPILVGLAAVGLCLVLAWLLGQLLQ